MISDRCTLQTFTNTSHLIFITLFFSLNINRINSVFLKSSQIFTGFGELSFFHTFSNIPMDESMFDIHKIKLVVKMNETKPDPVPPTKTGRSGNPADQYIDQPAYKFCPVNDFFTNSIVTMSIVVGSIFLSSDKLFRVEELTVCSCTYFICKRGGKKCDM